MDAKQAIKESIAKNETTHLNFETFDDAKDVFESLLVECRANVIREEKSTWEFWGKKRGKDWRVHIHSNESEEKCNQE